LVTLRSPSEFAIPEGHVDRVDPKGEWWIEPFSANLRIEDGQGRRLSYSLRMGDAARGLGKVRSGGLIQRWPENWIFTMNSDELY
jgi:hypothetical protein